MTLTDAIEFLRGLERDFKGDDPAHFADAVAHVRNVLPQLIGVVQGAAAFPSSARMLRGDFDVTSLIDRILVINDALTALAVAVEKEKG